MKLLHALLMTSAMGLALSGCSGSSSSDSSTSTDSNTTVTKTSYSGAASAGDFATFSKSSDNKISYSLKGKHFDGVTGSLDLTHAVGGFYTATTGGSTLGMFFSGSLGLAALPSSNGNTPFIVGLTSPSADGNTIGGKDYIYFGYYNGSGVENIVHINTNGTLTVQDLSNAVSGGSTTTSGCWAKSSNGNYLNVLLSPSANYNSGAGCSTIAETTTDDPYYYRVVIKPGTERAGFVVDYADGKGFGVGLEKKQFTTFNAKSYDTYSVNFSSFTTNNDLTKIALTSGNPSTGTETTYDCSGSSCQLESSPSDTLKIYFNKYCGANTITGPSDTNLKDYDGMVCAVVSTTTNSTPAVNDAFNVLVDPEDGYFFAHYLKQTARITLGGSSS